MNSNKKIDKQRGSVLVLVLFGVLILSIIGISALNQSTTEIAITRNMLADKTAFFITDNGIFHGINELRETMDPTSIMFEFNEGNLYYKSGSLEDDSPQYITGFKEFLPPPPKGVSIEMGGDSGIQLTAWDLTVSGIARRITRGEARKEIQSVVVLISSQY